MIFLCTLWVWVCSLWRAQEVFVCTVCFPSVARTSSGLAGTGHGTTGHMTKPILFCLPGTGVFRCKPGTRKLIKVSETWSCPVAGNFPHPLSSSPFRVCCTLPSKPFFFFYCLTYIYQYRSHKENNKFKNQLFFIVTCDIHLEKYIKR